MSTPATPEAALAELNQMERVEPDAPPAPPEPAPLNVEDEAAVQAALDANAIQVPDGDSLVPSSDVGKVAQSYRAQIKTLKGKLEAAETGSAKAQQLETRVQQLESQLQQATPYVQAYQQIALQPQPQAPAAPDVSDDDADNYARLYDLYKSDGSGQLDRDRGRKIVTDVRKLAREAAEQAAEKHVAPIHQMSVAQLSKNNLARAMNTVLPNGARASRAMLEQVWAQIDPSLTSTVEGAREAFLAAVGRTYSTSTPEELAALHVKAAPQRGANGQFASQPAQAEPIPEAIPREASGGQTPQPMKALSEQERKFLSATGMNEADYLKQAGSRFGGR